MQGATYFGGSQRDRINDIAFNNGGIFLCGKSRSTINFSNPLPLTDPGNNSLFIVDNDPSSLLEDGFMAYICDEETVGFVDFLENETSHITFAPNPTFDFTKISNNKNEDGQIFISDITGNIVGTYPFVKANSKLNIDLRYLPSSIYIIKILYKTGFVSTGKIVKL